MERNELNEILKQHKLWLESLGTDGKQADLREADLRGADLSDVDANERTCGFWSVCPESGAFVGYKKAKGFGHCQYLIVKLQVPASAKRSSATTRKCRVSKAKVLSIESLDGSKKWDAALSRRDPNFVYRVGETVEVDDFDENRWNECSTGIHLFITRQEAVNYYI